MLKICRVKEGQKEWLEEIPAYTRNYTILCCKEISFDLSIEKQKKKCKECGKEIEVKIEGYIACVR